MENMGNPFVGNNHKRPNYQLAKAMREVMVLRNHSSVTATGTLNLLFNQLCNWNGLAMQLQGCLEIECSGFIWTNRTRFRNFMLTAAEQSIIENGAVIAADKLGDQIVQEIRDTITVYVGPGFYASRAGGDPRGAVLQLGVKMLDTDPDEVLDYRESFQQKSWGQEGWPVEFPQTNEAYLYMLGRRALGIDGVKGVRGKGEKQLLLEAAQKFIHDAEAEDSNPAQ